MRSGVGLAIVSVALLLTTWLGDANARRPFPLTEGPWLAYSSMTSLKPSDFGIGAVKADGSGRVVLARGSQRGTVPNPFSTVSWSPDGTWLAFAGTRRGARNIYKLRSNGTGLQLLRNTNGGRNPVIAPDGGTLAFARDNTHTGTATTWLVGLDGRNLVRLMPPRKGVEYLPSSFSPDGSLLAVTRRDLGSTESRVLLFTLNGCRCFRVFARRASEAVFSPDGLQVALVRNAPSHRNGAAAGINKDIYVTGINGNSNEAITQTPQLVETHPSWDPSGQRLAFNSYHLSKDPLAAIVDELLPFGNSIMQVNTDGSCRQKLVSLKAGVLRGPVWYPGGGHEANRIQC
jgi:Tol biopolymer transport system component